VLSPDANSIAVVYYSEGKAKSLREDHWNLLEVDVATGGQTRIAKDGRSPAYSPDGKYLLFTDRRGKLRIYNRRTQALLSVLQEPGFREGYWLEQR
jgi:Tol biopolymer transport system component